MQVILQESVAPTMDFTVKTGSSRGSQKGDSFAHFLSACTAKHDRGFSVEKQSRSSREKGAGAKTAREDAEDSSDDHSQDKGCETAGFSQAVCPGMPFLALTGEILLPEGALAWLQGTVDGTARETVGSGAPFAPVGGAAGELALWDVVSLDGAAAAVEGAAVAETVPLVPAGENPSTSSRETAGQFGQEQASGSAVNAPVAPGLKGKEVSAADAALRLQGWTGKAVEQAESVEQTGTQESPGSKAGQAVGRVFSQENGPGQGGPEKNNQASLGADGQKEKLFKVPVSVGSSGGEADAGFASERSGVQIAPGTQVVPGNRMPVQAQEAFMGRLARVLQEQMIHKSELLSRDGVAEIKLELKPEYLGRLLVRLSLDNGGVNARFVVENHQVRSLIENNITHLKQCLADQGINWQEASVDVGGSGSGPAYADSGQGERSRSSRGGNGQQERASEDYLPASEERLVNSSISYLA